MKLLKVFILLLITINVYADNIELIELKEKDIIESNNNVIYVNKLNDYEKKMEINKNTLIVKKFDMLINELSSYKEVYELKKLKEKFIKKYIEEEKIIKDVRDNLNKFLEDRRNKKFIHYQKEYQERKNLMVE